MNPAPSNLRAPRLCVSENSASPRDRGAAPEGTELARVPEEAGVRVGAEGRWSSRSTRSGRSGKRSGCGTSCPGTRSCSRLSRWCRRRRIARGRRRRYRCSSARASIGRCWTVCRDCGSWRRGPRGSTTSTSPRATSGGSQSATSRITARTPCRAHVRHDPRPSRRILRRTGARAPGLTLDGLEGVDLRGKLLGVIGAARSGCT